MSTPSDSAAETAKTRDTLRGGRDVEVTIIPPTVDEALGAGPDGYQRKTIFVRKIPFLQVDTVLLPAWGKSMDELKAYTKLTEEQIKQLTDESQIEVLKVGREMNFFILKECLALQIQTLDAHGQSEMVAGAVNKALEEILKQQAPKA